MYSRFILLHVDVENANISIASAMHKTQVQRPEHKTNHTEPIKEKMRSMLKRVGTGVLLNITAVEEK